MPDLFAKLLTSPSFRSELKLLLVFLGGKLVLFRLLNCADFFPYPFIYTFQWREALWELGFLTFHKWRGQTISKPVIHPNLRLISSWWFGVQCFFGAAGCDYRSGTRGTIFILMYVLSYVGGANLLRHAEGATWLAIVTVSKQF